MSRPRHQKKEIETVLAQAEAEDWIITKSESSSHAWGRMKCPHNNKKCGQNHCVFSIYSTPRSAVNHARLLQKFMKKCRDGQSLDDNDEQKKD